MSESTEKKYLKWYNKIGYGSGDIAGNVVYAFLSSFVMIYLTNTVGLNPGIVGTLIAVSKLLDGVTDVFFGTMIDKTHSRLGKARPWMLYGYIGCAVTLVAIFAIPERLGQTAQYAWFLIAYTLLNAVFYTANNIAYSALTALVTKNSAEQVEMGSYRFMFAFGTSLLMSDLYDMAFEMPVEDASYPILCTPGEDGCTLYAPDFPNLQITAPTMDAGLLEMKEKLHKALRQYKYPPAPTRQEQIVVPATGFLLLIRVA